MKKLDRYLIRKYLKSFFFTALLFTLIAIVIDFSEKVNKFFSGNVPTDEILLNYYLTYIPDINAILWPLFALIAVIFFCSRMAKNSEFIAMISGGMSFYRISKPFLIAGAIIATLLFVGNHFVLPRTNKIKLDFLENYVDKPKKNENSRNRHMFLTPETKLYVRYYNAYDSVANGIRIETFEDNKLQQVVKAQRMKLIQLPNTWQLKKLEKRTFNQLNETFDQKFAEELDTVLNVIPNDFISWRNDEKRLTSPEIVRFINREKQRGSSNLKSFQIELQKRSADPISIFILTIIGVAVATRKARGGIGLHLAIGIGIGAIFVFLSRFSSTIALNPNISPTFGVWVPNLVFLLVAAFLVMKAQK